MKKALWLLTLILLLAGCGGFSPRVYQNSLVPAPAPIFQELPLLPLNRIEPGQLKSLGIPGETKTQSAHGQNQNSDTEMGFCYRDEPLLLFLAQGEELSRSHTLDVRSLPFPSLKEEAAVLNLQPPLSEPKGSRSEVEFGSGASDGYLSISSRKMRAEKEEGKGAAGNRLGEQNGDNTEPLSPFGSGIIGQTVDRLPEIPPTAELEALSAPPQSPQIAAEVALAANSIPSNFLTSFPTLLNEKVKKFIDFFQTKADTFFTQSLARSQAYEGMMKKILREKELPEELFYLALIESGFNPYALSRAKASGIWQFMTKTAKRFGLKVDKWVDERRDPEKSTYAAAEYLKNLHEMFNCWFLATASYNAGEGKILQAMKRAKSQDFWAISNHRYLKQETKEYVPRLLAAMIIAQDPTKYGFSNIDYHPPLVYEKVVVPSGVRLDQIARAAETNIEEIRALNPSLRRDKTPPQDPSYEIKLPPGKKEAFERNFSHVFKLDPRTARKHLVRQGDTLGQIAKKYKVDLRELCEGNGITAKTSIKPGMTLLLPP